MRSPLILALTLGVVSYAGADRVITIPTGKKIPFRKFKIESFVDPNHSHNLDRFIGVGITPEFEVDYHGERFDGGPIRDTLDFSYNYVTPFVNQAPGISVGVMDALNRTKDGRRFYLAATWRQSVDQIGNGNLPLEATLGIAQGRTLLPMVGVTIPFSQNLRFLVEDNGIRIATGFEIRAFNNAFGARFMVRDQAVLFGASLTLRF